MFNKIWKEQITKPKGKLGIWKPKEELKPREKEDKDCCEKAREYWINKRMKQHSFSRERYLELAVWATQSCQKFIVEMEGFMPAVGQRFKSPLEITAEETKKIYDDCMGE